MVSTRSKAPAAVPLEVTVPNPANNTGKRSDSKKKKSSRISNFYRRHPLHDFHLEASLKSDQNVLTGRLQGFLKMPIDIFAEVCSYLEPLDLRHLSLTNQGFRSILMSREAKHMWRSSRQYTFSQMPDCPPDVTEPQYIYFMFTTECNACDDIGPLVDFLHCLRFCENCDKESFIGAKRIGALYSGFPKLLLPNMDVRNVTPSSFHLVGSDTRIYYEEEVRDLYERILAISTDSSDEDIESTYTALLGEVEAMLAERRKAAESRQAWLASEIKRQQDAKTEIHEQRFSFLAQKCVENGHDALDLQGLKQGYDRWWSRWYEVDLTALRRIIECPTEMTHTEWETHRAEIEATVQAHKSRREVAEVEDRLAARKESLLHRLSVVRGTNIPIAKFEYPRDNQFLELASVDAILKNDTLEVTNDVWASVSEEVTKFVADEQHAILQKLCRMQRFENLPLHQDQEIDSTLMAERLSLATSTFICPHCHYAQYMRFPDIITHRDYRTQEWQLDNVVAAPPGLIAALLAALELPSDITSNEFQRWGSGHNYACTRCDPKVAHCHSIPTLVIHYTNKHEWFSKATSFALNARAAAYLHLNPVDPLPTLIDDHDCIEENSPYKEYKGAAKGALSKLQNRFQTQVLADPDDDLDNMEDHKLASVLRSSGLRRTRTCLLCPVGFSPLPTSATKLKLHIETRHAKTPDLAADATFFNEGDALPHTPCP